MLESIKQSFRFVIFSVVTFVVAFIIVFYFPNASVEAEGLQIFIGSENSLFGMTGCSTIISPFRNKNKEIIGAIGVVGPMRINYAKIIPVVDYTAKLLGKSFKI